MKVALAAFGMLAFTGCVRAAEGVVREQAANAFACADYALHVEEVGPDVYRASGCGQELIYACRYDGAASGPKPRAAGGGADHDGAAEEADDQAFGNGARQAAIVCARRP
jgi:hypothetical protein